MKFIRSLVAALFLTFIFVSPLAVHAQTAAMVYVKEGNDVLYNENSDTVWPAASITKLMTMLVLNDMKLNWEATVALSRADEVGGARLRVAVGAKYKRVDLLHAALLGSANNATHALARTSGVSMKEFVRRMNAKAKALGMNRSYFVDPTGINPANVSTAADLALLIEAAKKVSRITTVAQKEVYTMYSVAKNPQAHTIKNTDAQFLQDDNFILGKTGFLYESRYNFAMVTKTPSGKERTVVVLNLPSMQASFQLAQQYARVGN